MYSVGFIIGLFTSIICKMDGQIRNFLNFAANECQKTNP
jgi:hypothetical protein